MRMEWPSRCVVAATEVLFLSAESVAEVRQVAVGPTNHHEGRIVFRMSRPTSVPFLSAHQVIQSLDCRAYGRSMKWPVQDVPIAVV